MNTTDKPWWQQATALVSIGASGAITGFSFTPKPAPGVPTPTAAHIRLLALQQAAQPVLASDTMLRSAIVHAAKYYLKLAQTRTPAEMEALIWQQDSIGGADHGPSCAAFASLTLELASRVAGQPSWVSGGTSYPWPLHSWVDGRVDPNPASPGIVSVLTDAEAHHRWHPLGDGYTPQPGDWVLFNGHVEVVTKYAGGVLSTIGGDSLPNFSVNAHEYPGPLAAQGVVGFVNNGDLSGPAAGQAGASSAASAAGGQSAAQPGHTTGSPVHAAASAGTSNPGAASASTFGSGVQAAPGTAAIPGVTVLGQTTPAQAAPSGAGAGVATGSSSPGATGGTTGSGTMGGAGTGTSAGGSGSGTTSGVGAGAAAGASAGQAGTRSSSGGSGSGATAGGASAGTSATGTAVGRGGSRSTASGSGAGTSVGGAGARATGGASGTGSRTVQGSAGASGGAPAVAAGGADVPGVPIPAPTHGHRNVPRTTPVRRRPRQVHRHAPGDRTAVSQVTAGSGADASVPGAVSFGPAAAFQRVSRGAAAIPGVSPSGYHSQARATTPAQRGGQPEAQAPAAQAPAAAAQMTGAQRAFIAEIAPGAMASQRAYGIPASVTIAQAIDESGWGQSSLATQYHNLFGMKGDGPAGTDTAPTEEYENGQWVEISAGFRAYDNVAQSIGDHARLLATSPYYQQVMTDRHDPDAFASALTGVYATDPDYGDTLIGLMQQYNLYQYDHAAPAARVTPARATGPAARTGSASIPGLTEPTPVPAPRPARVRPPRPAPARTSRPSPTSPPRGTSPAPTSPPRVGQSTPTPPTATSPPRGTSPAPVSPPRTTLPAELSPPTTPASPTSPASTSPSPGQQHSARPSSTAKPVLATLAAKLMPSTDAHPRQTMPTSAASTQPATPRTHQGQVAATPHTNRATATTAVRTEPATLAAASVPSEPRPPYQQPIPRAVRNSFASLAKAPLYRGEPLYRDVASHIGIAWQLLAACDWMQCEAKPRHSPVHGEKLGTLNGDGTVYWTKSAALEQCGEDLVMLASTVYGIDLTARQDLSVRDLANVYAAFRWGVLLKQHRTSAMEFPYSVAGLTVQHVGMRWPSINEPGAPDKPGSRFRMPFGAVPVVLSLGYPATE